MTRRDAWKTSAVLLQKTHHSYPQKANKVQILELTHHTLNSSCHSKTNKGQIHSKCLSTFCWARASSTDVTPHHQKKPHSHQLRNAQQCWDHRACPKDSFSLCHKLQTVLRRYICNTQQTEGLMLIRCTRFKLCYSPHHPCTRRGSLLSGQTNTPWSHPSWSQCCWWWASPFGWPKGVEAVSINTCPKSLALGDRGKISGYPYTQSSMERQGTPCSLLLPEEPPTQLASEGLQP